MLCESKHYLLQGLTLLPRVMEVFTADIQIASQDTLAANASLSSVLQQLQALKIKYYHKIVKIMKHADCTIKWITTATRQGRAIIELPAHSNNGNSKQTNERLERISRSKSSIK